MLIINLKNYQEATRARGEDICRAAEQAMEQLNVHVSVAPPNAAVGLFAKRFFVPVLAQHVDDAEMGSTTGYLVPEALKAFGVKGSLVNHSEHRMKAASIANVVRKLNRLDMLSVVCVRNPIEAKKYAKLNPTYIAIEPPELIGSGRAISRVKPTIITKAIEAVKSTRSSSQVLCGAGIVTGNDVSKAMELGAKGILVASGIVKAERVNDTVFEFAKAMRQKIRLN